jgi:quinol monooxygenase YgiN
MGRMQDFISLVQQWEQDALAADAGLQFHGVYLHASDNGRVLVVSQFDSEEAAATFIETGLLERFHDEILTCTGSPPRAGEGWELFYAAAADGSRIVFGEEG